MNDRPKRAAIYVRVSSERQAKEDRVSIEMQLSDCETYCRERGYAVVARYVDKEKYRSKGKLVQPSGQRKDRPQYQAMLKAALEDEFDLIIAWKEDRLYRGMYAAMPFSEVLDEKGKGLDVGLVKETFDRKMLGIKAAIGKMEVDGIRERMLMGRRARLEQGEVPGGDQVKYGYRKVNRRLEIDQAEAHWVRQIFDWYVAGANNMQIRRRLNGAGVPPRKGKLWAKPSLETLLTTEAYATGSYITTLDGEEFSIACPPIISMETWQKAREVRAANRFVAKNLKEDYLCVGLVYCACGWKCQAVTSRANQHKGYHSLSGIYRCPKRGQKPESLPPECARDTGSKKVDDYVWNVVRIICADPELVRQAILHKLASLQTEQDGLEAKVEQLQRQQDGLNRERQWVITQARKGFITEDDMQLQLSDLQLQEQAYSKDMDEVLALLAAQQEAEALSAWADRYLSEVAVGMRMLDMDVAMMHPEQRAVLAEELESWRFAEKFPADELAQLRWAILEEKRKIVRTLISRVVITRREDGKSRKITPILSIDLPADMFLVSGDQSLEYIESRRPELTLEGVKVE